MDPASFTFLLLLAAGLGLAKPEDARKFTRAAAMGAGYAWGSTSRLPATAATAEPKTKGASKNGRTGSTGVTSQPTSIRQAARMGWDSGVQAARQKQAEGRDLIGRTRRVVQWGSDKAGRVTTGISRALGVIPAVRQARTARKAQLDAAKAQHQTQDPPAAPAADKTDTEPPKEPTMSVPTTDLANIDQFRSEGVKGQEMMAHVQKALAAYAQWAASLADRASSAAASTADIRAAVASIAESAKDPEAATAACQALVKGCDNAKAAAEPLSAVDAQGDVRAFQPA